MKRLTSLLAGLMLTFPALAQDVATTAEDEPEEIKRYTVEVIIFSYAENVGTGTEIFVPDVPDIAEFDDMLMPDEDAAIQELTTTGRRRIDHLEVIFLDDENYSLGEIFERMERLDVYEPLMHFGWTQIAWPEEDTPPLTLHAFDRPPAGLDGSLTLYLSRYLHLVVDLEMAGESETESAGLYGSLTGPVRYRISEDRILKNGEIRYFDHPKFGMVAKVTRIEPDEAPTQEPG